MKRSSSAFVYWITVAALLPMGALGLLGVGCATQEEGQDLTSLRRSGEVTFVCMGPERQAAPISDCPQGKRTRDGGFTVGKPGHELFALVTQTLSAELAVVRVTGQDASGDSDGKVIDLDQANPGITPLRVGEQPGGVVTTPGGLASFVTVAEPGREGIFGIPSSCILPPTQEETRRDLTTWPACSLPSKPGAIQMLLDDTDGASDYCDVPPDPAWPYADSDAECIVDLDDEVLTPGQRKLVVALPDEGKLVVVDAQDLLDRERGSYAPCFIEAELPLRSNIPRSLEQPLPDDMVGAGTGYLQSYPDISGSYSPRPAGMDVLDGRLMVADRGGPLVHLLDARDPCNLVELEPLVATSFNEPDRIVTTSRVAISPVTSSGERFAYAVDEVGEEMASVMVFDLSADAVSRLPILREGSPLISFEAPDRLQFSAAVKDIAFAELELPVADPATGLSVSDVYCDPDPTAPEDAIGALYRPSSDDAGARPLALRGIFGYALLSDGRLVIIDVEDFDEPCRRPTSVNTSSEMDYKGCQNDPDIDGYYTLDGAETGVPTVTDEASCRIVEQHRTRSAWRVKTDEGDVVRSPALRSFASLTLRGQGLPMSRLTLEGKRRPILLGADFEAPDGAEPVPAFVYVGSTKRSRADVTDPLVIDPNSAEQSAPVLPFFEPRAYPSTDVMSVVYEGDLDRPRITGRVGSPSDSGVAQLTDDAVRFCDRGVQGRTLTSQMGQSRFGLDSGALSRFVTRYSDFIQVTGLLLDETDTYWSNEGLNCGLTGETYSGEGFALCDSVFGDGEEEVLNLTRDFEVVSANDDYLEIGSRLLRDPTVAKDTISLLKCCFPGPLSYRIRGGSQWIVKGSVSGFRHNVVADDDGACVFDTSPLSAYKEGRAFEVASTECSDIDDEDPSCGVGLWNVTDVVCAYDATKGPVDINGQASDCVYSDLTRRFVVYRGLFPSERDMSFNFEVAGGFSGLSISLTSSTAVILPVSMNIVPNFGAMGVVDSENRGLMMIDLPNSRVAATFY